MRIFIAALLVIFALPAFAAGSQSDDLTWTMPTQRVDGVTLPISEIARTEIEVSRDGVIVEVASIASPDTAYTYVRPLPPNYTLCYRARVVDTDGLISDWTGPVCKTVKGRPNPPNIDNVR